MSVKVRSGPHGLTIEMLNGTNMRCVFNNSDNVLLPDTSPYPAIVLKMEDGSSLLLPIVVGKLNFSIVSILFFFNGLISVLQDEIFLYNIV